jgi:hypothetical protein
MSQAAVLEYESWADQGIRAIEAAAATGEPFDAWSLSLAGLEDPPHPNHWGSLFLRAKALQIIERHDYHISARPARAHGVCARWKAAA